eukprot:scaffold751_cov395-Prasinococcus_capsulatus_cf.AAC.29
MRPGLAALSRFLRPETAHARDECGHGYRVIPSVLGEGGYGGECGRRACWAGVPGKKQARVSGRRVPACTRRGPSLEYRRWDLCPQQFGRAGRGQWRCSRLRSAAMGAEFVSDACPPRLGRGLPSSGAPSGAAVKGRAHCEEGPGGCGAGRGGGLHRPTRTDRREGGAPAGESRFPPPAPPSSATTATDRSALAATPLSQPSWPCKWRALPPARAVAEHAPSAPLRPGEKYGGALRRRQPRNRPRGRLREQAAAHLRR